MFSSLSHAALSATTANTIQGSKPYFSFDGGTTKATDLNALLGIKLSDNTTYDASYSGGTITLPTAGDTFDSVKTIVVANNTSTNLSTLSGIYFDDDGDVMSVSQTTGTIKATWKDKDGVVITNLSDPLTICGAPYSLSIVASSAQISSIYGDPKTNNYGSSGKNYTITIPTSTPVICYAKPGSMTYASGNYAGPASQWHTTRGFKTQSTSNYALNFPTTGADSLYFDLDIAGLSSALTWPTVTVNGITATASNITNTTVRITLTGPTATSVQMATMTPTPVMAFTSPTTILLQGKDSSNVTKVSYGFRLTKWFLTKGAGSIFYPDYINWCKSIGNNGVNYELVSISDLTNATGSANGSITFTGTSPGNYYQRKIGGGLFSEWGKLHTDYGVVKYNHIHTYTRNTGSGNYRAFLITSGGNGGVFSDQSPSNGADGNMCVSK